MTGRDLLVVGPAGGRTGGIASYIDGQRRQLGDGLDVEVHDTHTEGGGGVVGLASEVLQSLGGMARFPRRSPPAVVHVHTSHRRSFYRNTFYVLYAAHVWDRPVVVHVHGSSFDEFLTDAGWAVRRLQSLVFDACSSVVVLSEYWRDVLAERVPEDRLVVLPNAVDASAYEPVPGGAGDRPRIVFLSNLIARKGVPEFLDAVEALGARDLPPFEVTIAGDGPLSGRVEEAADAHANVEYRGYVDEAEKRALLSEASIYALPTHAEGLPFAILEAMAGANAVVSTTVGSIPEVIEEEHGRLVDPGDVDALTAALAELLAAPDAVRRMGERNCELVAERYSWSAAAARLEELYETHRGDDAPGAGVEADEGSPPVPGSDD